MIEYTTETGSIYQVDDKRRMLRRASGKDAVHRAVTDGWKTYQSVVMTADNRLLITWGTGRDAFSMNATQYVDAEAPDEAVTRATITSTVVKTSVVG